MTELTDQERETVRDAAIGAMTFVSQADAGFFAMFKESMAGSKALAKAPESIRELFTAGGLPSMPKGEGDVEDRLLARLGEAVSILQAKAPEQLEGFKAVILEACDAVANASKGVSADETAAIEKVRSRLATAGTTTGSGPTAAPAAGSGDPLPPPSGPPA